jgi:hypothetical protein
LYLCMACVPGDGRMRGCNIPQGYLFCACTVVCLRICSCVCHTAVPLPPPPNTHTLLRQLSQHTPLTLWCHAQDMKGVGAGQCGRLRRQLWGSAPSSPASTHTTGPGSSAWQSCWHDTRPLVLLLHTTQVIGPPLGWCSSSRCYSTSHLQRTRCSSSSGLRVTWHAPQCGGHQLVLISVYGLWCIDRCTEHGCMCASSAWQECRQHVMFSTGGTKARPAGTALGLGVACGWCGGWLVANQTPLVM